jgi:RNase P subunit RPR2
MKRASKTESKEQIEKFFLNIKDKSPKEIKKIRKLAMSNNIPLRKLRKKFCKKCFTPYKNPKIRINNKIKGIACENCGYISRWKLKIKIS